MLQTKVVEKFKTHILRSISFNRGVYDIMWNNLAEPERPQIKIWPMRITC